MIVWTSAVLSVLYACVLYFCIAPVQRSWACFTWKGVLEIHLYYDDDEDDDDDVDDDYHYYYY